MTLLVPGMLFGWVFVCIYLFFRVTPHRAVLVSVIAGWLLLPTTGYDIPGIPPFDKNTSISIGLLLGGWLSGHRFRSDFQWTVYDLPMIVWCLCPLATSLSNGLGMYDGFAGIYSNIMVWGIPYLSGRIYFRDEQAVKDTCLAFIIGGACYALLCLYEIRMSPQLNRMVYGFFPHEWIQHKRYGGWRPIVFMQHGLMVALWMAASATTAFWFWRGRLVETIRGIPIGFLAIILIVTSVLCKTVGGWFALAIGCLGYYAHLRFRNNLPIRILLASIPIYILLRISGILPASQITSLVALIVDQDRVASLGFRLLQEDLFNQVSVERILLGWGMMSRGWPTDPETGKALVGSIDALWVIVFSSKGLVGLISLFSAMLIGPWFALNSNMPGLSKESREDMRSMLTMLSLIVILFMIDCLANGMINPIYIMCSGALVSWSLILRRPDTPWH